MQPVAASNEYTVPASEPTKTRPPATVGWLCASSAKGKPNAHFSFKFGTCSALNPAAVAGWKRAFVEGSPPHPFHIGPAAMLLIGELLAQRFGIAFASAISVTPSFRPPRYPANIFLSSSDSPWICV